MHLSVLFAYITLAFSVFCLLRLICFDATICGGHTYIARLFAYYYCLVTLFTVLGCSRRRSKFMTKYTVTYKHINKYIRCIFMLARSLYATICIFTVFTICFFFFCSACTGTYFSLFPVYKFHFYLYLNFYIFSLLLLLFC